MNLFLLKSKIHRCVVKQADLNYVGSITIDKALMDAAHIYPYEKVQVVNIDNGQRFETYAIGGEENSGIICLNGAAARCAQVGDKVIIMTYCALNETEIKSHSPIVVMVDGSNQLQEIVSIEIHGDVHREIQGINNRAVEANTKEVQEEVNKEDQEEIQGENHKEIHREIHGVDFNDNLLLFEEPEFFSLSLDEHQ